MKSENEFVDQFSALSSLNMSSEECQEIWANIECSIHNVQSRRVVKRSYVFLAGTGAIAAIFFIVGVIHAIPQHVQSSSGVSASTNSAMSSAMSSAKVDKQVMNSAQVSGQSLSATALRSITGITIVGNMPAQSVWYPKNKAQMTTQIVHWLTAASPVTMHVIQENHVTFQGYTLPVRLHFTNALGTNCMVYPAYQIVAANINHSGVQNYKVTYTQDVVAVEGGQNTIFLKSPGLYSWLKNGKWQAVFTTRG